MKLTAKAPCRVDLAGGTLDIWPLYLYHANAVTVNFAVDRYASWGLEMREDGKMALSSRDLGGEERFDSLDALRAAAKYTLPLLAYLVRFFAPETGLSLRTDSEAPAGAGIAGSSTLIIAIVNALNRLTGAGYKLEELRQVSQNIEAQIIRVSTGCQDYYPAIYGGVSAVELRVNGIVCKAIPVDLEDFNERIVLAYTGKPRNSGINNWEVTKAHVDGDKKVHPQLRPDRGHRARCAGRSGEERLDGGGPSAAGGMVAPAEKRTGHHDPAHRPPGRGDAPRGGDRGKGVRRRGRRLGVLPGGARRPADVVSDAVERDGATVLPVRVAPQRVKVTARA